MEQVANLASNVTAIYHEADDDDNVEKWFVYHKDWGSVVYEITGPTAGVFEASGNWDDMPRFRHYDLYWLFMLVRYQLVNMASTLVPAIISI